MPHVGVMGGKKLTFSRFANREAIHMNAKMMMIDFCTKLPVRRKPIMNVECYNPASIPV